MSLEDIRRDISERFERALSTGATKVEPAKPKARNAATYSKDFSAEYQVENAKRFKEQSQNLIEKAGANYVHDPIRDAEPIAIRVPKESQKEIFDRCLSEVEKLEQYSKKEERHDVSDYELEA